MAKPRVVVELNRPEKAYILGHYASQKIRSAQRRLCFTCAVTDCLLIPITTKGEDCPYHKEKINVDI